MGFKTLLYIVAHPGSGDYELPPEEPENECAYCGYPCHKRYCSTECKKAYESDN